MPTLITPMQVIEYSVFEAVKIRPAEQLTFDIIQASQDIFAYVGHKFDDATKYPVVDGVVQLPAEVKLAFIKVTEYYALTNGSESSAKGFKSERIGDYSYELAEAAATSPSLNFSLESLLGEYKSIKAKGGFGFRLRSL